MVRVRTPSQTTHPQSGHLKWHTEAVDKITSHTKLTLVDNEATSGIRAIIN